MKKSAIKLHAIHKCPQKLKSFANIYPFLRISKVNHVDAVLSLVENLLKGSTDTLLNNLGVHDARCRILVVPAFCGELRDVSPLLQQS